MTEIFRNDISKKVPDDSEIGLMSGKTKHDEISIGSTEHMLRVGIMVRSGSLLSGKWDIKCYAPCMQVVYLMKSMILCSPSPGTLASERITLTFFQPASLFKRSWK